MFRVTVTSTDIQSIARVASTLGGAIESAWTRVKQAVTSLFRGSGAQGRPAAADLGNKVVSIAEPAAPPVALRRGSVAATSFARQDGVPSESKAHDPVAMHTQARSDNKHGAGVPGDWRKGMETFKTLLETTSIDAGSCLRDSADPLTIAYKQAAGRLFDGYAQSTAAAIVQEFRRLQADEAASGSSAPFHVQRLTCDAIANVFARLDPAKVLSSDVIRLLVALESSVKAKCPGAERSALSNALMLCSLVPKVGSQIQMTDKTEKDFYRNVLRVGNRPGLGWLVVQAENPSLFDKVGEGNFQLNEEGRTQAGALGASYEHAKNQIDRFIAATLAAGASLREE